MSNVRTLGKELCRWNSFPENQGKPYPKAIRQLIYDSANENQKDTALLTGISERKIGEIVLDPASFIEAKYKNEVEWKLEAKKSTYKRLDNYKIKHRPVYKPVMEVSLPKGVKVKVYQTGDELSSLVRDLLKLAGAR